MPLLISPEANPGAVLVAVVAAVVVVAATEAPSEAGLLPLGSSERPPAGREHRASKELPHLLTTAFI